MTRMFRGVFIVWVLLRHGLDVLLLESVNHTGLRLLSKLVSWGAP
jgi:ubiquinone biosynthesis protein